MAKITAQDCILKFNDRRLEFIVKDQDTEDFNVLKRWFRALYGKYNPKFSHADGNFNLVIACCPERIANDLDNLMKAEKFVDILCD